MIAPIVRRLASVRCARIACAPVAIALVGAGLACAPAAQAQGTLFTNVNDNGYFLPFNSSTPSTVRYGDAGWLGFGPASYITSITMRMVVQGGASAGTTDLSFRWHDGDPAGQFFGPGTVMHQATVTGVTLPAAANGPSFFDVTFAVPFVLTDGGFNNIGWSIGVNNFSYAGSMGFALSTASGQTQGFYTNNASSFNGSSWSLFAFSSDPNFGVANYVVDVRGFPIPAPGVAAGLGLMGLASLRRRREGR